MIPLRRLADGAIRTAVRAERRRVLGAFEQLAETYLRNAEFHRRHLPQVSEVETAHADDLRRVIALCGGVR